MKSMNGIQEVLRRSLLDINNQCQGLRQDITEFVNNVLTSPAAMVKIRLSVISIQITMQASNLYNSHDMEGIVFAMLSDTDLSVHWSEKKLSIKGKEDLKMRGYLILSLEEIAKVIEHLANRIDSGQLVEAVEWINQYEPFLALKAKKLL